MNSPLSAAILIALLLGMMLPGCAPASADIAPDEQPIEITDREAPVSNLTTDAPEENEKPPPAIDPTETYQRSLAAVDEALSLASSRAVGLQHSFLDPFTYLEILNPQRAIDGSLSAGTTRTGSLVNASILPEDGEYHQIIERHRTRGTRFGTTELVDAIERAAESVALKHGGAPLRVGNLGFRSGGPIPWSNSHEAGRDADLAFYVLDNEGESVPSPDLISFDNQGRALSHSLHFDIPRNWTLIRALLTDPDINVQWLFISEALKNMLLEHALEIGEDLEFIKRAARVVHQPTDALPHDDHLHLRIGCSRSDRLEKCIDWGPRWDWYDWHDNALLARTLELRRAFFDSPPEMRLHALDHLHQIRAPHAPEVILFFGIRDEEQAVRQRAFEMLEDFSLRSVAALSALETALQREDLSTAERETLYHSLRTSLLPEAIDIAWQRYFDDSLETEERLLALRALEHHMEISLIPELIEALSTEESPSLRQALSLLLRRISARADDIDWTPEPSSEHERALQDWNQWWDGLEEEMRHRDFLLRDFYTHLGFDDWEDLERVDDLILLLRSDDDHIRYNINLILRQWTGRWTPRDWEQPADAYRSWTRWWNRNQERMIHRTPQPWE